MTFSTYFSFFHCHPGLSLQLLPQARPSHLHKQPSVSHWVHYYQHHIMEFCMQAQATLSHLCLLRGLTWSLHPHVRRLRLFLPMLHPHTYQNKAKTAELRLNL